MHRANRAVAGRGRDHRPGRSGRGAEPQFLAFQVSDILLDRKLSKGLSGGRLEPNRKGDPGQDQGEHHTEHDCRMAHAAEDPAEHPYACHRDEDDRDHGDCIGPERGVLERMGAVRPKPAAAIGAELLDGEKRRHGSARNHLLDALQGHCLGRALKRHRHSADHHQRCHNKSNWQQHEKGGALHVDEEIAEVLAPGEAARQRRQGGDTGRCRYELQPHQRAELREIAQRHFAGIVLQVGIRGEGGGGVEDQAAFDRPLPSGLSGRYCCRARMLKLTTNMITLKMSIDDHVTLPVLRGAGDRSADELERPGELAGCPAVGCVRVHRPFHVAAERPGQDRCRADDEDNEENGIHNHGSAPEGLVLGPVDGLGHQIEKAENCESKQQIDDHHQGDPSG